MQTFFRLFSQWDYEEKSVCLRACVCMLYAEEKVSFGECEASTRACLGPFLNLHPSDSFEVFANGCHANGRQEGFCDV